MDFYNSCAIYNFVLGHYTVTYFQNNYCTLFGKTNTSPPLLGSSCFTGTPSPSPSPSSLSLHCYYFYKVRAKLPLPILTERIIDPGFNQPTALPPSSWLQFFDITTPITLDILHNSPVSPIWVRSSLLFFFYYS